MIVHSHTTVLGEHINDSFEKEFQSQIFEPPQPIIVKQEEIKSEEQDEVNPFIEKLSKHIDHITTKDQSLETSFGILDEFLQKQILLLVYEYDGIHPDFK